MVSISFCIADSILQFLITGLQQPQLAAAAATALQSICAQCQDQMVTNFNGLLQVAHAVDSFNLSNDAVIGVLKGDLNRLVCRTYKLWVCGVVLCCLWKGKFIS